MYNVLLHNILSSSNSSNFKWFYVEPDKIHCTILTKSTAQY